MRLLVACILFSSVYSFAAPVGCPSAPSLIKEGFFTSCPSLECEETALETQDPNVPPPPKKHSWCVSGRAGYEGDFVADARLQQHGPGHGRVDNFNQQTNAGTLTYNMLNRLDLFAVLGSSRACADWRFKIDDFAHRSEVETLYNFLWGAGVRGTLYKSCTTFLSLGGRYEQCDYDTLSLTVDGIVQPDSNTFLRWREWQIDINVGYQIDLFTPYLGLKYSNVHVALGDFEESIASNGAGRDEFKNRTPVGVFIGCSLSSGKYFMLNVEGRLIDEEAVTISGDFRF